MKFISKYIILRRIQVGNFVDIIKVETIFISFRRKYAGVSRTHWDVSRDLYILGSS